VAYVRTVKTASGALAVQIVHSNRRGSREIEHIGSAHSPEGVEALRAAARQRLHANQDTLDFGDGRPAGEALPIISTQSKQLWEALSLAYDRLGFAAASSGDEVFRSLVLARLIEPASKLDTIRVLTELGIDPPGYRTIFRRLPSYATDRWRQAVAAACAAHVRLGPATLVLYDVTTLYFETDQGDGFREPGFSKERRLEPQITVGLLSDVRGFPLQVHAFEGNTAETKTILPVITAFQAAHGLPQVTVVADAGMLSEANLKDLEDAGLRFIVGMRIPDIPYQVAEWRRQHPGQPILDGQVFIQPWVMGAKADPRKRTIFYQYRADRAKRTLKGIDQQIAKAEKAVAGQTAVKRNRFVQLTGGQEDDQPDPRDQGPSVGRVEGLHHQSGGPDRRLRPGRLSPAVADREELSHVQERPPSSTDLPPQTRVDRSPPEHRDDRSRRSSPGRTGHRLEHRQVRQDPATLPHHHHPGRRADRHRRRPPSRRRSRRTHPTPRRRHCALIGASRVQYRWENGTQTKGFKREQFEDSWRRYCPEPSSRRSAVPAVCISCRQPLSLDDGSHTRPNCTA